jgi:hypothetical protein
MTKKFNPVAPTFSEKDKKLKKHLPRQNRRLGSSTFFAPVLLAGVCFGAGACGSSGGTGMGGNSGGGTGGAGTTGTAPFSPCADDKRVGAFTMTLKHAEADGTPAYTEITGAVKDAVNPADVWVDLASGGGCHVVHGPTLSCSPACASGQICTSSGCKTEPGRHSVGAVTFTGLVTPLSLTPNTSMGYYSGTALPTTTAYPPYAIDAALGLQTAGGDYAAFSLKGAGITPLEVTAGQTLNLKKGQPLTVTWVVPAAGKGRIRLIFDIAHHANIAAELRCDVPDTGTVTIPANLVGSLIDQGTAGFPNLNISRTTVDSTTITPGCVEFSVVAAADVALMVEGVTSCMADTDCSAGQTCMMPPYVCK